MTPTRDTLRPSRETERLALSELRSLPSDGSFDVLPAEHPAFGEPGAPVRAWRSRNFMVQLYDLPGEGALRLSIQRSLAAWPIRERNRDRRPISWEELMTIKAAVGFGDRWAVEIFPPDADAVNVADMRHLWLLEGAPAFGWVAVSPQPICRRLKASSAERIKAVMAYPALIAVSQKTEGGRRDG